MPNLDKYPIDEQLLNDAWAQMRILLDHEMPEEKRRRRVPPFWWWMSGAATLIALGMFIHWNNKLFDNTLIYQKTATVPNHSIADNTYISTSAFGGESKIFNTEHTLPKIDNSLPSKSKNNAVSNYILAKATVNEAILKNNLTFVEKKPSSNIATIAQSNEILAIPFVENVTEASEFPKAEEKENIFEGINASDMQETSKTSEATVTLLDNVTPLPLVKQKVKRKYNHGIFGRFNYTGLVENGYAFGYIVERRLKKSHHLQGRIFWEKNTRFTQTVTESFMLPKSNLQQIGMSNTGDTTISQIVYPYKENCACIEVALANNVTPTYTFNEGAYVIVTSSNFGIGLDYSYQLTPRVDIMSGLGFSTTLTSLSFHYQGRIERYNIVSLDGGKNSFSSDNKNFSFDANNTTIGINSKSQRIFSSVDGYFELGANYHLGKHIRIGAAYRYGIIDVTRNDALGKKDYNSYGFLQGAFIF